MMKIKNKVIAASIFIGLIIWIIDAILDALIFYRGKFLDLLILRVPQHELYMRFVILGFFLLFGILISRYISKLKKTEQELQLQGEITNNLSEGIYQCRVSDGTIIYVNPRFEEIFGYLPGEMKGKHVSIINAPTERTPKETVDSIVGIMKQTGGWNGEIQNIKKDGSPFLCYASASIFNHPEYGEIIISVHTDITERKKTEEALKESEEKHRTLFETMAQGVVYQNADGKIFSANTAAEKILGLSLDQMQGRTSIDPRWKSIRADGSDFPGEDHPAIVALKTGKKVKNVKMGVFNPIHEDYTWININATPQFRNGEKSPYQVYTTFEDITKQKIAEEKLQNSNFWLEESQRVSNIGLYLLDIPNNEWSSSKTLNEIFAISDNYKRDVSGWINIVHPEQKDEIRDYFQKEVIEKHKPFNKEYRIIRISDGEERWVYGRGDVSYDVNNNPIKMIGTIQDITERKMVELELKTSQKELKELAAHLNSVREEERTLVAHELHDEIAQALSALKMDIYMLEKKLPKNQKDISHQMKETNDLLDKTIQTTRRIYSELRPTLIEHFSIKEVLEDQLDKFKKSNNLSGFADIDLSGTELKEEISIVIFRIVQEALNNVKWHSQAKTVNIGLKNLENHYKLTIKDDGIGIKEKDLNKSKSFGIIGMKERTSFLGGEIEFTETPHKGTTITVTFPLNPENN